VVSGSVEPFAPSDAKKRIRSILDTGVLVPSGHALSEMEKDDLTLVDCTNVLRGGWVEPAEWEKGNWRYRVRTARICVVVAFRSESKLAIVTAWRERP
jgi:hypothetical protein